MEINNAANAGIALINASRQNEAGVKASRLIVAIEQELARIPAHQKNIEVLQGEVKKLAVDRFSVSTIVGSTLPETAGAKTIADTITKMNDDAQKVVEERAASLTQSILRENEAIAIINKGIAKLREDLMAIDAKLISADILG